MFSSGAENQRNREIIEFINKETQGLVPFVHKKGDKYEANVQVSASFVAVEEGKTEDEAVDKLFFHFYNKAVERLKEVDTVINNLLAIFWRKKEAQIDDARARIPRWTEMINKYNIINYKERKKDCG